MQETTPSQAPAIMRTVACAALLAGLALAALLPVYGDEIGWRFQERAGIEGVDKLFSDNCGANTLAAPPWFMMPVRWYSALFNTAFPGPAWVRASGLIYALALLGLLVLILRRLALPARERGHAVAIGAGLLALGTLPLLMALSRPEQPILLAAAGAILLGLGGADGRHAWPRALAIAALATIALSYHLKALFLAPVFAAAILLCGRGRAALWPRIGAGALMAAMATIAALNWIERLQCPGDPVLRAFFGKHNAAVELTRIASLAQVPGIVAGMIANAAPFEFALLAAPTGKPMAAWLPPGQVQPAAEHLWRLGLDLAWRAALLVGLVCAAGSALAAWRSRTLPPALLLALACAASALGWAATSYQRNVYEASFVLPLLMLAIVLAVASPGVSVAGRRMAGLLGAALAAGGAVSVALLAITYAPPLLRALDSVGYVAGQPHSVSLAGHALVSRDVRAAARLCSIPVDGKAQGLLVDDVTYPVLQRTRLPQHSLGVLGLWRGTIRDPVGYLKSRGSDGAVVTCSLLPPALRAGARAHGQFCCMGPATGW